MSTVSDAADTVERAADSTAADRAARVGLASRGLVYVLLGLLALLVAWGRRAEVDQKGALQEVAEQPFGATVVLLLALGFACYSLWRFSEAVFGPASGKDSAVNRARSAGRGFLYASLTVSAVTIMRGSRKSQSAEQRSTTAEVMDRTGGRWLVGIFGLVVLVVGLVMAWNGLRAKYLKHLDTASMTEAEIRTARTVSRIGVTARGLVVALAGLFVGVAAVQHDPSKAGGINGALKELRDAPYGPFLLSLAALGLVAFGVHGLLEARRRHV